ncbi:MAG: terpene cyclase/mutase family protein [Pirellulales bacterium]|nr:terpene cyclase/mutase family protein [Pirellulales bacterium]
MLQVFRTSVIAALTVSLAASFAEAQRRMIEMTKGSEDATRKGNAFLKKCQNRDGGYGQDANSGQSDIGITAMVGLSMLAQGNTPIDGPKSRELRKITEFLLKAVDRMPANDITEQTNTQLQRKIGRHAHSFFAAAFLSQVLGEDWESRRVRRALQKLTRVISAAQQEDGTWGRGSWAPMLGTVMGWVSLRGAHSVGISVQADSEKTARKIVAQMKAFKGGGWMMQLYKNATGIRVLYALGEGNDATAKEMFKKVQDLIHNKANNVFSNAGGEEYIAFHLITECMLQAGGEDWKRWFPTIREGLVKSQNADGSWTGHHCITSRTFCTAAAILVLQSPNRFLPISQE